MKKRGKVEVWPVEKLRENAKQAIFCDMPEHDFKPFVEDIRTNGLREPIEVLPGGTILAGHQRLRAIKELGHKTVDVIVRHDLTDPIAAERYFLTSNNHRRQMDPIAQARCAVRMCELEFGASPRKLDWSKKEQAKKWLSVRLGLSSRQVDRLVLALSAPSEVQTALQYRRIELTLAGKIALQEPEIQEELAEQIEALYSDATQTKRQQKQAIRSLVQARLATHNNESGKDVLLPLIKALRKEVPGLEGNTLNPNPKSIDRHRPILERTQKIIAVLLKAQKRPLPDCND